MVQMFVIPSQKKLIQVNILIQTDPGWRPSAWMLEQQKVDWEQSINASTT